MPIPVSKVRVHGRNYSIETVDNLMFDGEPQLGLCDATQHTIQIMSGPDAVMADTMFHELIHAANPELTEEQVLSIERSMFAILADNPKLTRWMLKKR